MGRKTRTLRKDEAAEHFEILNSCYNPWGSEEEWKRRYLNFPKFNLTKDVVVVEENGEWAGGGTAWFREAYLPNNKPVLVYGAGDLYVLSNFRGKGIYSTAMRGLNEMAQRRGAVLGFGFPSIYGVAASALPKYGFTDAFNPVTKIFLLKPEKFLDYFLSRLEEFVFPRKFDGLKIRLVVPLDQKPHATQLSKTFFVEKGQLKELIGAEKSETADLSVKTDFKLLTKVSSLFYERKKSLYPFLLLALVRRRLGVRMSFRFLKAFLGF